jgi:subtilase family serine protease
MSPPRLTRRLVRAGYAAIAALTLTAGVMAAPANAATHTTVKAKAASTTRTVTPKAHSHLAAPTKAVCPKATKPGQMECLSVVRTDVKGHKGITPLVTPSGYGPTDLQSAYALPSSANGSGQTVAIVDAQDDPNAAADLTTYRSQYGLPACTTASGCFKKVNQTGGTSYPSPDSGWAEEESLDLDMVSAVCPNCHIILVEATSADTADLGTAVNEAVALGAKYVSNSYGGSEDSSDPSSDSAYYNHPGVAVTASSGDSGYGVEYPAASQYVTAVGGTSLSRGGGTRGWTETAWNGAGSGCSADDAKPSWQKDTGCSKRTVADVSAVADPNTGVAVYDSYQVSGWVEVGGTSVSSPITASVFALAGTPAAGTYPSSYPYAHTANLNDVTSGSNGSCSPSYLCTAGVGYDGPTGLGTPNGVAAYTSGGTTGNTVTVTNPGNQTTTTGSAVSLQIHATDSATGQTLTYSATGLPTGLSINASTGLITGTAGTAGTYNVSVTVKDGTGASGSTSFTWTVSTTGGGCSAPGNKVGNGGFESGTAPWTTTAGVINANGSGETSHAGTYFGWLDGYGTTHTDTASQSVTIPAGCHASLSFWLHIDTAETTTTTAYDKVTVKVGSTTVATFSNLNHNTGYTQHTYDVSANAGQTVTLQFSGTEDSSLQTSFVIDDIAVTAS